MNTPELDRLQASEQALRQTLTALDTAHAETMVGLTAASAAAQQATTTAGSEYDAQVTAALATVTQGIADYGEFLTGVQEKIDAVTDQAAAIAAIGAVDDLLALDDVPTSGAPDVAAADVNTALGTLWGRINGAIDQLNGIIGDIKDVLTLMNDAAQKLKDVGQTMKDQMPSNEDNEAEKAVALASIEGAWTP